MPFSEESLLLLVMGANVLVYVLVVVGAIKERSRKLPSDPTIEEAFRILESSLKMSFPDLPEGYTWKEVMNRLRTLNLETDWYEIENTFRKYEDYRYGGIEYKNANAKAVLKLAMSLPRGERFARAS